MGFRWTPSRVADAVRGALAFLRRSFVGALASEKATAKERTLGKHTPGVTAAPAVWADAVEAARREWLGWKAYFNCVDDPELVDHAIYAVQAAERKYMYLLRQARLAGPALEPPAGSHEGEKGESPWFLTR